MIYLAFFGILSIHQLSAQVCSYDTQERCDGDPSCKWSSLPRCVGEGGVGDRTCCLINTPAPTTTTTTAQPTCPIVTPGLCTYDTQDCCDEDSACEWSSLPKCEGEGGMGEPSCCSQIETTTTEEPTPQPTRIPTPQPIKPTVIPTPVPIPSSWPTKWHKPTKPCPTKNGWPTKWHKPDNDDCGTNKNSGPGRPIQCYSDDDCCHGFRCKNEKQKCVPDDKSDYSKGGSDYSNVYKTQIEITARAIFKSSESGVDGSVEVDQNGNVFIDLDVRNLHISDCDSNEIEYYIYNKFDSDDSTSMFGYECTKDIIGDIFNPFKTESCLGYDRDGDYYFECSIGDLSGRFDSAIVDGTNKIVIEGNISEKDMNKQGGFCGSRLTPQVLYQRSIVFTCKDKKSAVLFCAPFQIDKKQI